MKTWTIFCPGPSLAEFNLSTKLDKNWHPSQSIAVNGAILINLPISYWTMLDWEVFNACVDKMSKEKFEFVKNNTTLWVNRNWFTHMHSWAPDIERIFEMFRCEFHQGGETEIELFQDENFEFTRENVALGILKWTKDFSYTLFSAIVLAILKGAEEIRIYGADMKGAGYFKPGLENGKLNHTPHRWDVERKGFEILKEQCRELGIKIVRLSANNEEITE